MILLPDYERMWNDLRMMLQFRATASKAASRWDAHYTHQLVLAVMERMEKDT